ncbi:MAG: hypothetical protein COA42_24065 [Alteromonadaceae bacterium]|nr:MAG: hypothetical protein COA42_24065 [Alteromonadaceae bacterium]
MTADGTISFSKSVLERGLVEAMITRGEFLIIAGDEKSLAGLPSGNWIAGSIPYFMTDDGGVIEQDKLYVTTLKGLSPAQVPRLTLYDENSITRIAQEAPEHGFTILLLPASSPVHLHYAQNSPDYENMYFSPIMGWVSGIHLDELGERSAKVGFGPASGMLTDTQAVAMHIPLPTSQVADIQIVNLFQPGDGPAIHFPENGFGVTQCRIGEQDWNFADYVKEYNIDTRLPLVANYCGVMVNVSIQEVLDQHVNLYAPVFPQVEYRFAKPIDDYVGEFSQALPSDVNDSSSYSCNCILNFLYSELEGKKTAKLTGPMTFGEVAYQLLNQTLVYLNLKNI